MAWYSRLDVVCVIEGAEPEPGWCGVPPGPQPPAPGLPPHLQHGQLRAGADSVSQHPPAGHLQADRHGSRESQSGEQAACPPSDHLPAVQGHGPQLSGETLPVLRGPGRATELRQTGSEIPPETFPSVWHGLIRHGKVPLELSISLIIVMMIGSI